MSERHLDGELLDSVFQGHVQPHRLIALVLRHLMDLCPACRQGFEEWKQSRPDREAYRATLEEVQRRLAAQARAVSAEQQQAEDWLRELLPLEPEERLGRIRRARTRFRGRALAEGLLGAARFCLPGRPEESGACAEAALEVARRSGLEEQVLLPLLAQGRALMGNARRALGDLRGAETLLERARNLVEGTPIADPLVRAELDCLEGVLRKDQRRFDPAVALLNRAVLLYQQAGAGVEAARALLALSTVYDVQGDPEQAARVAVQALEELDPQATPDLYLFARYNQAHYLHSAGRHQEALEALTLDLDLYERCRDLSLQVRFRWLGGKLAAALGDREEAEEAFLEVRAYFEAREMPLDVGHVSMDLALLYLEDGRLQEVAALAAEIARYFAVQEVHPEALAAVVVFERAAAAGEATAQQIRWLARYLEQAQHLPEARSQPPS